MQTTRGSARDRLLDAASELFYREGIRAVGIDTIVEHSGVARMTLYRHFASKDDLIAAYLKRQDRDYWPWFESAVGLPGTPLPERLTGLFAALREQVAAAGFRGCPFLNAVAEFPTADHPAHRIPATNKGELRDRLRALAVEGGVVDAEALADQLVVLVNGAYASVAALGSAAPVDSAAAAALALVDVHRR